MILLEKRYVLPREMWVGRNLLPLYEKSNPLVLPSGFRYTIISIICTTLVDKSEIKK